MLIVEREFVDCLLAINALPEKETDDLQDKFRSYSQLFSHNDTLTTVGDEAFVLLEHCLSTLGAEYKSKIPLYITADDKRRVLEFTIFWWQTLRMSASSANIITRLFHTCHPVLSHCNRTFATLMVSRNHPVLLQLVLDENADIFKGKIANPHHFLGQINLLLLESTKDPAFERMFKVLAQAIAQEKIKLDILEQMKLFDAAIRTRNEWLAKTLLPKIENHITHNDHTAEPALDLLVLALNTNDLEFIEKVIKGLHSCLEHFSRESETLRVLLRLALQGRNQTLLDMVLGSLKSGACVIHISPEMFAEAYGFGGQDLVDKLKPYHLEKKQLEVIGEIGGLPLYSADQSSAHMLGSGSFGSVWSATTLRENTLLPVAVKTFQRQERGAQIIEGRVYQHLGNKSEYTLKLYGFYKEKNTGQVLENADTPTHTGLVLQHAFFGDLSHFRLSCSDKISDAMLYKITLDTAKGLAFCHDRSVLLGDIKPSNILLRVNDDGSITACHADFNLSIVLRAHEFFTNFDRGAISYRAPERILKYPVSTNDAFKGDVWSLGCVMSFLVFMNDPWSPELDHLVDERFKLKRKSEDSIEMVIKEFAALLAKDKLPRMPEDKVSDGIPSIASVMRLCFFPNPSDRINSKDLVAKLDKPFHFKK